LAISLLVKPSAAIVLASAHSNALRTSSAASPISLVVELEALDNTGQIRCALFDS
jgi:hypothetical protein